MKFSNKGITLIELLIVLAIMGIIIAVAFSFNLFGMKTFKMGDEQSDIQFDIRMASDFITKELRNAIDIEIYDAASSIGTFNTSDGNNYIIYQDSKIKHIDNTGTHEKTDSTISELSFLFNRKASSKYTMSFSIIAVKNNQDYQIDSEVQFNNSAIIKAKLTKRGVSDTAVNPVLVPSPKKMAIRYKKP